MLLGLTDIFLRWFLASPEPQIGSNNALLGATPFILMMAVMYFVLIRPNAQAREKKQKFLASLVKNDEVITDFGMHGKIVAFDGEVVVLEIADRVKIKLQRERIAERCNDKKSMPVESASKDVEV